MFLPLFREAIPLVVYKLLWFAFSLEKLNTLLFALVVVVAGKFPVVTLTGEFLWVVKGVAW